MIAADAALGAAVFKRGVARFVEAGLGEVAKAGQGSRGIARGDRPAVARERRDRRIDAFDEPLQPLGQRHEAGGGVYRGDQDTVAAIGEIEPRAAAGREHAGRRAKTAQPFQPDRAA